MPQVITQEKPLIGCYYAIAERKSPIDNIGKKRDCS